MSFWDSFVDGLEEIGGAIGDLATAPARIIAGSLGAGFTGAKAAQTGIPGAARQGTYAAQTTPLVGQTAQESVSAGLLALDVPYQQLTAKPIVSTLGRFAGIPESARTQVPFMERGEQGIASPGQTVVAALAKILPGTQGVEKIDWTKQDEIDAYFKKNWGLPKFTAGALDIGFRIFLDPFLIGARGIKATRTNIVSRPITGNVDKAVKRIEVESREVDAAVAGLNSPAKPLIDRIMTGYNTRAEMLVGEPLVYLSNNPSDAATLLWQAREYGREAVGDILKIGIGNEPALRKVADSYDALSKVIKDTEELSDFFTKQLQEPINKKQPYWSTAEVDSIIAQNNAFLKEAAKESAYLERILSGTEELDIPGYVPNATTSSIRGAFRTQTWAKYEALEQARGKINLQRAKSYWDNQTVVTSGGKAVRVLSWVDESSIKKQVPSGHLAINQRGVADTYSELIAGVRQAQREAKLPPLWAEERVSQWMELTNKTERRQWLKKFEQDSLFALFRSKLDITDLNDAQMAALRMLSDKLIEAHAILRTRANSKVASNNFTLVDDSGDPVIAEGLKQFIKKYADDFDISVATAKARLSENPVLESQIPDHYQMVDFSLYSRIIDENPIKFENLINELRRMPDPVQSYNRQLTDTIASIRGEKQPLMPEKITAGTIDVLDYTVNAFNAIWKPSVLLRLGYPIRNIASSVGRMTAYLVNMQMEMGWKYTGNTIKGMAGYYARIPKYGAKYVDYLIKRAPAVTRLRMSEGKLRASIVTDDRLMTEATSLFNATERSIKAELSVLNRINKTKFRDVRQALKDSKKELTKDVDSFVTKLEEYLSGTSDDIFDMNRADEMIQDLFNTDNLKRNLEVIKFWKTNAFNEAKILEDLLDAVSSGKPLSKFTGLFKDIMEEGFKLSSIELQGVANIMNLRLEQARILTNLEVLGVARTAKIGKLDALFSKVEVDRIYNGSERVKIFDDVEVDGAFGGWIANIARGDVSSMNTVQQIFVNSNRGALNVLLKSKSTREVIEPTDSAWVRSWTDFVSNQLRNDKVMEQFAQGKYDEEVVEWLGTKASEQYRSVNRAAIEQTFDGNLEAFVSYMRLQFERNVPNIGDLRTKFLENRIKKTDALAIPADLRPNVPGVEIVPGELSITSVWNSAVNGFFKAFGAIPEDVFARNPFYNGIYQAELKRLFGIAREQGTDITNVSVQESIMRSARRTALKTVEENLYTVRRYTGPAEQLRAISPFYMAGQSEARFWLGMAIKNPAVPYLGILSLNSVNKAFMVRDADEFNREASAYSFPFNTGESLWLTVPKKFASILGVPSMEYLKVSKDSMNLWLQGEGSPFVPQFGPLVQYPVSTIFRALSGSKIDPDREINRLGDFGDKIRSYIMPQGRPMTANEILTAPRWIQSLSVFIKPQNSPEYWSAVDTLMKEKQLTAWNNGEVITNEIYSQMLNDSSREARMLFFYEALFRGGLPASTKWASNFELVRSEYFLYQERYGRIKGAAEFEKVYGTFRTVLASSSLSYNPGGILSTPQTVRNYKNNKQLFQTVWALDPGIAGQVINEGDVNDYSAVADEKLRGIRIGGKNIKGTQEDLQKEAEKREIQVGWGEYIPKLEVLNAQMLGAGIRPNTKAAEPFEEEKKRIKAEIGAKYPAWGKVSNDIVQSKNADRIEAIYTVLNDRQFMRSPKGQSDLWQGLLQYAVVREQLRSVILSRDGQVTTGSLDRVSNQDIKSALEYERMKLGTQYATFFDFSERYLTNDNLAFGR